MGLGILPLKQDTSQPFWWVNPFHGDSLGVVHRLFVRMEKQVDGTSKIVWGLCHQAARRSRSMMRAVVGRLNESSRFWLPLGVGVVLVGTVVAVAAARRHMRQFSNQTLAPRVPVLAREQQARVRIDMVDGVPTAQSYQGVPDFPHDAIVGGGFLPSSEELVGELSLFTAFKVRDYTLLLQCCSRAGQLIKAMPDHYGAGHLPRAVRYKLIYGSVARAMSVGPEERRAMEYMMLQDSYGKSKGWNSGVIPIQARLRDVLAGSLSFGAYCSIKLSSLLGTNRGIGPARV